MFKQACAKGEHPTTWFVDSGCSKHMTGDSSKFSSFRHKSKGTVSFGNSGELKVMGIGDIRISEKICDKKCVISERHGL